MIDYTTEFDLVSIDYVNKQESATLVVCQDAGWECRTPHRYSLVARGYQCHQERIRVLQGRS